MKARILDLHAHPSLKMYYLPYLRSTLHALVYSGAFWNPLSFRMRYANLRKSPVKVVMNAHYPIERRFIRHGFRLWLKGISWTFGPLYFGKLHLADPWRTLLSMMATLEASTTNTNRWAFGKSPKWKLCTSYADIEALNENEIGVVHAIEGAHALGDRRRGESKEAFWRRIQSRLEYLKGRGVAMIALAHFFDNMFSPQTDGTEFIPKLVKGKVVSRRDDAAYYMKRASWSWGDPDHLSEEIVRALLELGIVIDVVHTQEHARDKIYDLCEEYGRPVVVSHVGLQHFFAHEYNLSDAEIHRIHDLGGVVGLILSKRWLEDPIERFYQGRDGIPNLIKSMLYIKELTGDVSCIGIGTDFDGLTDPFDDCYTPAQLHRVVHAMQAHFTDDEIDQILYRNALRVLKNGWV